MTTPSDTVVLHAPDLHNPPIDLDLDKFMGTWHVTYSTLPLWKSKKDVTITYALKKSSGSDATVQFDDTVEYRGASDPATSTRSRVTGVDTLVTPESQSPTAANLDARPPAPTRYKWRGKGWLAVATSRWQVLGCSADTSPENAHAWAVTYFEKTLFTPQGLDIYARTPAGLPPALVVQIVAQAKALGGDVAALADAFFEVGRSGVEPPDMTVTP
ncbi:uncharacterized protein TRAVEDRAFT_56248 [Trametes versicolor FP-101664 SS1]|uniref:uncharacterized protein n=1 Tax=Trametes versicolor (strain FP-101664) TaxID=717944 RepID=UPI0004621711|nr:uncharacterized protein TRAVEDRAFT_56248 [Trametes versicolor FP-101664 SS1]EIW63078.1 hypothetical protein TRAVEDRAFT_56248 [Trametes versicolor FP-101664 SS1]